MEEELELELSNFFFFFGRKTDNEYVDVAMSIGRFQAKQSDIAMIEAPIDNTATVFKVSPKSGPFSLPDDKKMSNKKHSENTDTSTSVTINKCKKNISYLVVS